MSNENSVIIAPNDDKEMQAAHSQAQETFKYFWRELSWERRRIIPALEFAIVKVIFKDESINVQESDTPNVEHMWVSDIDFDGEYITGFLMNSPNWLRNLSEGDHVKAKLCDVSDWLFAIHGKVYGGFTVNLLRSRMPKTELKAHDEAWGLDFGDPRNVDLVYVQEKKGALSKLLGLKGKVGQAEVTQALDEHPMSINMEQSLVDELNKADSLIHDTDENGWTMLHREALAGNAISVKCLLAHGFDKAQKTDKGKTPLDLAKILDWKNVIELLSR